LASASDDESVIIWNLANSTNQFTFNGHENKVEYVTFVKNEVSKQNIFFSDYVDLFNRNLVSGTSETLPLETDDKANKKSEFEDLNKKLMEKSDLMKQNVSQGFDANKIHKEYIISCGRDKMIKLWDVFANVCIYTMLGHDNWVRSLAVSPNGKYLLSCSDDKSIRVWDLKSGRCTKKLNDAHERFVISIAVSQKYPIMASGSIDNLVKIWDCK
jgi:platelet-activating factor acetylhydrolase IB subunit alpha